MDFPRYPSGNNSGVGDTDDAFKSVRSHGNSVDLSLRWTNAVLLLFSNGFPYFLLEEELYELGG